MSEGIQTLAGNRLKAILSAMTSNRIAGVFTGFFTTALIQSSSATTVMVVSFVNAGLLTLRQSIGVIMGANIGTTITGILVAAFALSKLSLSAYALPIIAFAFPMLFFGRDKIKNWGIKSPIPDLTPDQLADLEVLTNYGLLSVILFVGIGTIITVILQSSSAAMALTLVICDLGYIPFDMAAAIILGENIGTTITANLAAIIGNTNAKRAARAHFIFNIIGVLWMIPVFYGYINLIDQYMVESLGMASPYDDPKNIKWALTAFHSSFNILNTLLLISFIPFVEKLVIRMVPAREEEDDTLVLKYIKRGVYALPVIDIAEAMEEIKHFGQIVEKMSGYLAEMVGEKKISKKEKLMSKLARYEMHTDELEVEIGDYLLQAARGEMNLDTSKDLKSMFEVLTHLEGLADVILKVGKDFSRLGKKATKLSEDQLANLKTMSSYIKQAISEMNLNLMSEKQEIDITNAVLIEDNINQLRKEVRKNWHANINRESVHMATSIIYRDLIFGYETMGDHIFEVSKSLVAPTLENAITIKV